MHVNQVLEASSRDKWIAGVDGSEHSNHALDWAAHHVVDRASTLEVVSAWQSSLWGSGSSPDAADSERQPVKMAAIATAAAAAERVGESPRPTVKHRAAHGGASSVLLDATDDAKLLVVGSHGLGGFRRLLLGTTSAQCATNAVAPTVVVPHEPPVGPERLVVAIDGSENSYAAANWAVDYATPGTVVTFALVWDSSLFNVTRSEAGSPDAADTSQADFNVWVDALADGLAANPATAGVEIARDFSVASPRPPPQRARGRFDIVRRRRPRTPSGGCHDARLSLKRVAASCRRADGGRPCRLITHAYRSTPSNFPAGCDETLWFFLARFVVWHSPSAMTNHGGNDSSGSACPSWRSLPWCCSSSIVRMTAAQTSRSKGSNGNLRSCRSMGPFNLQSRAAGPAAPRWHHGKRFGWVQLVQRGLQTRWLVADLLPVCHHTRYLR